MGLSRRTTLITLAGGATAAIACAAHALGSMRFEHSPPPANEEGRADLYNCEGCEAVAERDPGAIPAIVQLAGPDEPGERMILTGEVTTPEGKPAPGVIVYAHHTNAAGLYANGSSETRWSRRHGRLRGWARTGPDGIYTFHTIKPAPYPDRTMPAHVHLFIGEPGRRPYYIDDVVFIGEFGVTPAYRDAQEFRGGSGMVELEKTAGGVLLARRDIRLEPHPI